MKTLIMIAVLLVLGGCIGEKKPHTSVYFSKQVLSGGKIFYEIGTYTKRGDWYGFRYVESKAEADSTTQHMNGWPQRRTIDENKSNRNHTADPDSSSTSQRGTTYMDMDSPH